MHVNGWIVRLRELFVSLVRYCNAWLGGGEQAPATERDHVRNFLAFLEDRRVLYTPYFLEYPAHVVDSVQQVEAEAKAVLAALKLGPATSLRIARLRGACSAFLGCPEISDARASGAMVPADVLFFAVVALRDSLATEATSLARDFALDLPPELALMTQNAQQA